MMSYIKIQLSKAFVFAVEFIPVILNIDSVISMNAKTDLVNVNEFPHPD